MSSNGQREPRGPSEQPDSGSSQGAHHHVRQVHETGTAMRIEGKGMPTPAPSSSSNPSPRQPGTTSEGRPFPEETVRAVWMKSKRIPDFSHTEWATDICGDRIRLSYYGNVPSQYAWEVDHIVPVGQGGTDALDNLQPLQWENNRKKGNLYPWKCRNQQSAR
jgi:hypothetical protein